MVLAGINFSEFTDGGSNCYELFCSYFRTVIHESSNVVKDRVFGHTCSLAYFSLLNIQNKCDLTNISGYFFFYEILATRKFAKIRARNKGRLKVLWELFDNRSL